MDLSAQKDRPLPPRIQPLPEDVSRTVLLFNGFLERRQKLDGASFHRYMGDWLGSGLKTEGDLWQWLSHELPRSGMHRRDFDSARVQAEKRLQDGIWTAIISEETHAHGLAPFCPRVLFGRGHFEIEKTWVGVFNSRKPKAVFPYEDWLTILRVFLPQLVSQASGFASSFGTLTHDLVSIYAWRTHSPLLVVLPFAIEKSFSPDLCRPLSEGVAPSLFLTCQTNAVRCPKHIRMVCRDRLLALLSDCHLILEIRVDGNLFQILESFQENAHHVQWIFEPERQNVRNGGNFALLARSSPRLKRFSRKDLGVLRGADENPAHHRVIDRILPKIDWKAYLYHYTRACPGPWPGQSHADYLLDLLNDEALSAHTTLDTLIHILEEGRIRAGSKLVRGDEAVISWTSRPPMELQSIRRWNPALIRWTFEPYGIAVRKASLRKRGARPTVYCGPGAYHRLKPSDRFRFQRHEPPRCTWMHEREWRLPKDLFLEGIDARDAFIFLPDHDSAGRLERLARTPFAVVVLPAQIDS